MDLFSNIPDKTHFRNPVVTMGSFDGVHLGHKKIIDAVLKKAEELKGDSIVLTFESHPRLVLNPSLDLKMLTTNEEKIRLLKDMGIDHVLMLKFNREMANLHAMDFYNQLLIDKLNIRDIIIGYDHGFGKNREGGIELLHQLGDSKGIGVQQISEELVDGRPVSSTWIRTETASGNIPLANRLSGRPYFISGTVVHGAARGGKLLGFPTANLQINSPAKILPPDGVYAAKAEIDGMVKTGMLNIGPNPTFSGQKRTIEMNIFDLDEDLYGKEMTIFFFDKIRGEKKFSGPEELKHQLSADKEQILSFFRN